MERYGYYNLGPGKYQNNNARNVSPIILSEGNYIEPNNNLSSYRYLDKSDNSNIQGNYNSVNQRDNAKLRKFNSYSARIGYKNNNNEINGFYVTPIPNIPTRLIQIKVPDNSLLDIQKGNYHQVESVFFKASPKKYNYKPYRQPKRKHILKPSNSQKAKSFYKYNGYNNKRKY